MSFTRVINIHREFKIDYVYCGRNRFASPGQFDLGNPYPMRSKKQPNGYSRGECVAKHAIAFLSDTAFILHVNHTLRGAILGCYCKPLACHCDIYAIVANAPVAKSFFFSVVAESFSTIGKEVVTGDTYRDLSSKIDLTKRVITLNAVTDKDESFPVLIFNNLGWYQPIKDSDD